MKKAFSLIELMVVIAIVAVLAAIAVPAYKNYIVKAKLAGAVSFVNSGVDKSIQYYNAHGVFADAEQLGLPFEPGNPNTAVNPDESDLVPGLSSVNYVNNNFPGLCRFGNASASIMIGIPAGTDMEDIENIPPFDYVNLAYFYIDVNGVIEKRCVYSIYAMDPANGIGFSAPKSGNYIGGCVNELDNPTYHDDEIVDLYTNACD